MPLQFLTTDDLNSQIFSQFLTERSEEDNDAILESIEAQNIQLIRSKLKGRYDTDAIFSASGSDRHYLIIMILAKLTLYQFIRRNAARKVAEDYTKEWEWAMKTLEAIKAGKEVPDGLPLPVDENGDEIGRIIYADTKNNDYYI